MIADYADKHMKTLHKIAVAELIENQSLYMRTGLDRPALGRACHPHPLRGRAAAAACATPGGASARAKCLPLAVRPVALSGHLGGSK